jgi:hypothetical protein
MRKLIILLAVITPLFSFAQLSVSMVSQISTAYTELKLFNNQLIALSADSLTLDIYDISTQMQPQLMATKTLSAPASNVELMGDYLLTTEGHNLKTYSLTTANMPLVSSFPINGSIKNLSVSQQYAFVTLQAMDGNYALWYINLTDATAPTLKNYITFYNPISEMIVDGVNGFVAEYQTAQTLIFVFDLNWANLHVRNMKYLPTSTAFSAKGNYIYSYDNQHLSFYNWTSTGQLALINKIEDENILGISAIENGKCIAMRANELQVYEVQGGEIYNKTFVIPTEATSIVSNQDYAFCATGTDLYVLEVQATTSANLAPTLTSLEVYPNPAKESWKIEASSLERGDYRVELRNMLGQTVYAETFVGGEIWKLENVFEAGTYFYTVEKEGVIFANGKLIGL